MSLFRSGHSTTVASALWQRCRSFHQITTEQRYIPIPEAGDIDILPVLAPQRTLQPVMSEVVNISSDSRPIALWSAPRALSHAFEKMVRKRGDHVIFSEPFNDAWYYGPERGTDRDLPLLPNAPTYESSLRPVFEAAKVGRVFMRAQPWQLHPRYLNAEWLRQFNGFCLIRDPAYSLPSLYKLKPDLTEQEGGVRGLHAVWQMLVNDGESVPIVDAIDLQRNGVACVAAWCAAMKIERRDDALQWEVGAHQGWESWPAYVQTVVKTEGFLPPPSGFPEVPDERLAQIIDSLRRYYREMEAHKLVV